MKRLARVVGAHAPELQALVASGYLGVAAAAQAAGLARNPRIKLLRGFALFLQRLGRRSRAQARRRGRHAAPVYRALTAIWAANGTSGPVLGGLRRGSRPGRTRQDGLALAELSRVTGISVPQLKRLRHLVRDTVLANQTNGHGARSLQSMSTRREGWNSVGRRKPYGIP